MKKNAEVYVDFDMLTGNYRMAMRADQEIAFAALEKAGAI